MTPTHPDLNRLAKDGTAPVPSTVRPLLEQLGTIAEQRGTDAYAVGGCVRDWCLGNEATVDLDITVDGDGIAFAKAVSETLGCTFASHQQFGTATLILGAGSVLAAGKGGAGGRGGRARPASVDALRVDVASFRKETYAQPAAYPKVSAGTLRDDLFRRDFTINAIALAIVPARFGRLVDPFGGLHDLRAKRLRILHERSFIDDPSRILRAARFATRFGCTLERATAAALNGALKAGLLERLNRGRLRKELERTVEEPDPIACLARLGAWLAAASVRRGRDC